MAGRLGRLPRLTLFSGPQCSLCDTAKAELSKVRQNRAFELQTINIQDEGQERWKRKYVYWIPALHIDGKEVAKGRWDAQTVNTALDEWQATQDTTTNPSNPSGAIPDPHEQDDSDSNPSAARCFNCGSTDHILSRCSEPRNHKLIALTRQFYEFSKGGAPAQYRRIHEVAEWQKTRIKWLEQFVPGEIRGPELRNALGLSEGDVGQYTPWLKEMAEHGYPKGWIAPEDPRTRVWERLAVPQDVDDDEEPFEFWIHGDTDELVPESSTSTNGTGSSDDTHSVDTSDDEKGQVPGVPLLRRWARYPETFFSNDLLFAYQPPPPTRDEDPLEYLNEFLHLIMPPPPPDVSPPPLPPAPLPPNYPPPLLPMYPSYPTPSTPLLSNYLPPIPASYSTQSLVATKPTPHNTSDDTSDMDFSDSD